MTKQEKKLTKTLLKEMHLVLQHLIKNKCPLPAKEVHLHIIDSKGEGLALWCEAIIDEETGDIKLERGMSDITREGEDMLNIEVELEDGPDFDEEQDYYEILSKPSSRLLN